MGNGVCGLCGRCTKLHCVTTQNSVGFIVSAVGISNNIYFDLDKKLFPQKGKIFLPKLYFKVTTENCMYFKHYATMFNNGQLLQARKEDMYLAT